MGLLFGRDGQPPAPAGSPLPLSDNVEESRPEIGGSFGGFIAVVVVLAVIFLASCIGIFILLRDHEPTPHERQMRRARSRRRDFSTEVPIGPPGIRERLMRLFGKRNGWIKASGGDGDEWDASEDPVSSMSTSELRQRDRAAEEYPASMASVAGSLPRRNGPSASASTDSVEVELRAPSGRAADESLVLSEMEPRGAFGDGSEHNMRLVEDTEPDRHTSSPILMRASPPSGPSLEEHDEEDEEYKPRDDRTFSVQSGSSGSGSISVRSMRKFDNGTKFKEALSF